MTYPEVFYRLTDDIDAALTALDELLVEKYEHLQDDPDIIQLRQLLARDAEYNPGKTQDVSP